MGVTWQARGPQGVVNIEYYETVQEALDAMSGADGYGGIWEEDRETRVQNVDVLVNEAGEVVASASHTHDDDLVVVVHSGTSHDVHVYSRGGAERAARARQVNDLNPQLLGFFRGSVLY